MMEQQNYQNGNVGPATSNAPTGSSPAPNNNGGPVVMQSQPGAFHPHQFYGADMGSNNQLHVQNQAVLQHQQQQQQHFMQNNGAPFFGMSVDPSAAAAMGFDPMLRQQMMAQAAAAQAQQQQQQQQHCQQQGVYATYSSQSYGGQAGQNLQMNSGTRPADPSQQPQTQQIAGSYTSQSHLVPGGNNSTIDSSMVNSSIIGGVPAPAVSVATSMATTLHAEAASAAAAPPAKKPRGQSNQAKSSDAKDGKGPGDGQHKHQASRPSNSKKEQARRTASKRKSPPEATSSSETVGLSSTAAALIKIAMAENYNLPPPSSSSRNNNDDSSCKEMTAQEKSQANRDRNREHARCTRLRKKAYVSKLKELVDGLHAERSEEARKRRVAVQHLAEIQNIRRKVVHTFFGYHARYENDVTKWNTILEEDFWLKQPVTPYRSFRRCEIQKGSRILKGIHAMVGDAASMSVMIETIGSRNMRWLHRKRDDFLTRHASKYGSGGKNRIAGRVMPHSIVRQNSRLQHAVSSLSSSSGSSTGNGSGAEDERQLAQRRQQQIKERHTDSASKKNMATSFDEKTKTDEGQASSDGAKKVSSSSSSNDTCSNNAQALPSSNDFHDYHAPSLPDPLLESGGSSPGSDSPHVDSDNCVVGKHMCTDSSSGEDDKTSSDPNPQKKQKVDAEPCKEEEKLNDKNSVSSSQLDSTFQSIPTNQIARSGGILHNVKPVAPSSASSQPNGHARLSRAPVTALPPFVGIGKKSTAANSLVHQKTSVDTGVTNQSSALLTDENKQLSTVASSKPMSVVMHNPHRAKKGSSQTGRESSSRSTPRGNIITIDNDTTTSSQSSTQNQREIQAYYHINEDDMILTDDVLMCPFIFRSQEAVWCGALAECIMPGMLRACFSPTNKLRNVEMIFDAMGFCQQLERASGNEGMAQIIPNSLEMALSPNKDEARVITLAKHPFPVVSVNEAWTRVTGYTQFDCEGKDLSILNGERTDLDAVNRVGMPTHDCESVAQGRCACSVNVHYDINGREFLDFMCSYPLTNIDDEVTHILHVCQELPGPPCHEHENV